MNSRFTFPRRQNFQVLKDIVNGELLCYLIDDYGMVTIKEIPSALIQENARQTLQFVSQTFHTIAIYVKGPDIFVYSSGEIAQILRDGNWVRPCVMQLEKLKEEGFPRDISTYSGRMLYTFGNEYWRYL